MALAAETRRRGKLHSDHWFFSGLAILFLVSVFIGFARSYYLAGLFKAPLPTCFCTCTAQCFHSGFSC
jgi:hypothetical protein